MFCFIAIFIILFCPAQFGSICLSLFRALSLSHACQVRLGDLIPLDSIQFKLIIVGEM